MAETGTDENSSQELAAKWRRCIEDQAASGLSQARYCERHELSVGCFRNWKYRKFRKRSPAAARPQAFVPVRLVHRGGAEGPVAGSYLEVRVDTRHVVVRSGFDPTLLGQVLLALEQLEC